jgi:hypothetical protein
MEKFHNKTRNDNSSDFLAAQEKVTALSTGTTWAMEGETFSVDWSQLSHQENNTRMMSDTALSREFLKVTNVDLWLSL